jgi:hypothetical protein
VALQAKIEPGIRAVRRAEARDHLASGFWHKRLRWRGDETKMK